jgi:hypothetical protein
MQRRVLEVVVAEDGRCHSSYANVKRSLVKRGPGFQPHPFSLLGELAADLNVASGRRTLRACLLAEHVHIPSCPVRCESGRGDL